MSGIEWLLKADKLKAEAFAALWSAGADEAQRRFIIDRYAAALLALPAPDRP